LSSEYRGSGERVKRNIPEEICALDQKESLKQKLVDKTQCSKPTHYASNRDVANIGAVED
jgi:hypothetical protein